VYQPDPEEADCSQTPSYSSNESERVCEVGIKETPSFCHPLLKKRET